MSLLSQSFAKELSLCQSVLIELFYTMLFTTIWLLARNKGFYIENEVYELLMHRFYNEYIRCDGMMYEMILCQEHEVQCHQLSEQVKVFHIVRKGVLHLSRCFSHQLNRVLQYNHNNYSVTDIYNLEIRIWVSGVQYTLFLKNSYIYTQLFLGKLLNSVSFRRFT